MAVGRLETEQQLREFIRRELTGGLHATLIRQLQGSGGGGGGPPTGPAGGVLAGTYPNPTFAVDMATQAELDAAIAGVGGGGAGSFVSRIKFGEG